jgi:hypothetical protein
MGKPSQAMPRALEWLKNVSKDYPVVKPEEAVA